ncbi:hypothetical protein PC123_g19753 [Phytophthora cactorum]|nr:hypothetical protein PC123_g19753 [Phytophthora cactorum]
MESLTKAFACIGTTTKEDQSAGKVLEGYDAPELPVVAPSIYHLQDRLSTAEFGQLVTLQGELFRHVLGFPDKRYNVASDVVDATFAALHMHLNGVFSIRSSSASQTHVSRLDYVLERGLATLNARLGSLVSVAKCCECAQSRGTNRSVRSLRGTGRKKLNEERRRLSQAG